MLEFDDTTSGDPMDVIGRLIKATLKASRPMAANIGGIWIIADPKTINARPNYVAELQWTYNMALQHRIILDAIGPRTAYRNLVPELEELAKDLVRELDEIDPSNVREVIEWIINFLPVTYSGVMSKPQLQLIIDRLVHGASLQNWATVSVSTDPDRLNHKERGQMLVTSATSALGKVALNEIWLQEARAWLASS